MFYPVNLQSFGHETKTTGKWIDYCFIEQKEKHSGIQRKKSLFDIAKPGFAQDNKWP